MLKDLIERVERAEGPDRELDAAVARLFSNSVERDDGDWWWGPYNETPQRVPAFTESLDAVMTLLPAHLRCGFEQPGIGDQRGTFAWVWLYEEWFEPDWKLGQDSYADHPKAQRAVAATPALALLSAILKSMEAQ